MANTEFYGRVRRDSETITWKDILSEFHRKHTKRDIEYALLAGTPLDTATEGTMLQKWRKPWLFYPLLLGGIGVIAVIYIVIFVCIKMFGVVEIPALSLVFIFIPPLIPPLVLMIFFWELNIPRNITIYQMLGYFLIGGIMSLFATMIVGLFVPSGNAAYAAFSEEPAKLLPSLFFLSCFSKNGKRRVYGITGLVIGAAVGAGFGGFESAQYACMGAGWTVIVGPEQFYNIMKSEVVRGLLSLGGHTLLCAPYTAAAALHMKNSRLSISCFLNQDFIITFGCSTVMHFLWNSNLGMEYLKFAAIIAVLWFNTLYITRKCVNQAVKAGSSGAAERTSLKEEALSIQCINGAVKGAVWKVEKEALVIGRDNTCGLKLPSASGVSRQHCSIQRTMQGWTIRDLNSTYGTYIGGRGKLTPGIDQVLHSGDIFYLGGKNYAFRVVIESKHISKSEYMIKKEVNNE